MRFELLDAEEARAKGIEVSLDAEETGRLTLVENMPDGTVREVAQDGWEPEDCTFGRSLNFVLSELNKLADEVAALKK